MVEKYTINKKSISLNHSQRFYCLAKALTKIINILYIFIWFLAQKLQKSLINTIVFKFRLSYHLPKLASLSSFVCSWDSGSLSMWLWGTIYFFPRICWAKSSRNLVVSIALAFYGFCLMISCYVIYPLSFSVILLHYEFNCTLFWLKFFLSVPKLYEKGTGMMSFILLSASFFKELTSFWPFHKE